MRESDKKEREGGRKSESEKEEEGERREGGRG